MPCILMTIKFPSMTLNLESTYLNLPDIMYSLLKMSPPPSPGVQLFNQGLAETLGLPADFQSMGEALMTGSDLPPPHKMFAQAYAGHQFGHFNNLGDGRAAVLGELVDPQGQRWDLQYKGSGPTPYARRGDGKAALGPMLREYLVGEAFRGQGIPTTRILSVALTGETIRRDREVPGALALRAAHSHIRVGTFQFAAAKGGPDAVRALADYTRERHFPHLPQGAEGYGELFREIARRQARLVAHWMGTGFVHGVMNTDNMAVSGQSLDFGPCAFLDEFSPAAVFSSIDQGGRYAYGNQPGIAVWNLARLAETLIPLLGTTPEEGLETAQREVEVLPALFQTAQAQVWGAKLGLDPRDPAQGELAGTYLRWMEDAEADFTQSFRSLTLLAGEEEVPEGAPLPPAPWLSRWEASRSQAPEDFRNMKNLNPLYIPRNHWVEEALRQAEEGEWAPFHRLKAALRNPGAPQPGLEYLEGPGPKTDEPYVTYCGT